MQYSKDLAYFEKQHELNKHKPDWKIPEALSSRVELNLWEFAFVRDFYCLSSSRQQGFGVGAIPVSEILSYCHFLGIEDVEDFLFIIQAMDMAYLEKVREKDEQDKAAKSDGKQVVRGVNNRRTKGAK